MIRWSAVATIGLFLVLMVPESAPNVAPAPSRDRHPFAWSSDAYWSQLESTFRESRSAQPDVLDHRISSLLDSCRQTLAQVVPGRATSRDPVFTELESRLFELGPLVAAAPDRFPDFLRLATEVRDRVKECSATWDLNDFASRVTMYRLLYGQRAAVEEIMLQMPSRSIPAVIQGMQEPSATPWAALLGVPIHSGDILVSRGGAPTSALIARGSDFPGNFSHIALVHVDPHTHLISIIESHIERGVTISTVEEYIHDTKLRVMVLRLRSDLPEVRADPQLPHRAAEAMLIAARGRHIPYDFAMDQEDHDALFCSEVASMAYGTQGVNLWKGMSTISAPGVRAWLGSLGVRHFTTQEPSDLEYDPQLRVVAEWRDADLIAKDHIDNAVTEVMLEGADRGERLPVNSLMLPIARISKAYSWVKTTLGGIGPIPEGMSATAALRSRAYTNRHTELRSRVAATADSLNRTLGYHPPYWRLIEIARAAETTVAW